MKYTIIAAIVTVVGLPAAFATTTITPFNGVGGGGNTTQVVDNTGAPLMSATVSIGTFSSPSTLGSTSGPLDLNDFGWSEFASTTTNGAGIAPGIFGAFGSPGGTGTLPTTASGDFFDSGIGRNVFVVIADGAGEFIIWESAEQFATEDPTLGGSAVSFNILEATLLRGNISLFTNNGLGGPLAGGNGSAAVTFNVIPEPSSSFLFGAAGLALLIRRKR